MDGYVIPRRPKVEWCLRHQGYETIPACAPEDKCYFPGACSCNGVCARNRLLPCCRGNCLCDLAGGQ